MCGVVSYVVVIVRFNLRCMLQASHCATDALGVVITLFCLSYDGRRVFVTPILSACRWLTKCVCVLGIAAVLALILASTEIVVMGVGAILMGLGYGVMQPVIYDQTTRVASPEKTTLALAFVMSMNYLAILLTPPFIVALETLFHIHSQQFPFVLNLSITLLAVVWAYAGRKTFLFDDSVANDKPKSEL